MNNKVENYYLEIENSIREGNKTNAALNIRFVVDAIVTEYAKKYLPAYMYSKTSKKIELLYEYKYIDEVSYDTLHRLRMMGNKGAHGEKILMCDDEFQRLSYPIRMEIDKCMKKTNKRRQNYTQPSYKDQKNNVSKKGIRKDFYEKCKQNEQIISLRIKHLKRHLCLATLGEFQNLMHLQVADAKAHVLLPVIQERIRICKRWSGEFGREQYEMLERDSKENAYQSLQRFRSKDNLGDVNYKKELQEALEEKYNDRLEREGKG